MTSIAMIAWGALSSLGDEGRAFDVGVVGDAAITCVARDEELATAGLSRPFAARAPLVVPDGPDRATVLLEQALAGCARELDEALPDWRRLRVGAAIGTSSGGMRSFERLFESPDDSRGGRPSAISATYVGPLIEAARPVAFEPVSLVLAACASSTVAIGLGRAWLLDDRCDVVIAGGFDAVSVFVAAGFECLRATCDARGPRPFRASRNGLALGEGAAVVALVRDDEARRAKRVHAWVTGFGATCDATHLTSPDPAGAGLTRAAAAALADAGEPRIDLVSAHGTATVHNDASEAKAIAAILGERASGVPIFSLKGSVGHTLGAAGALELCAAAVAMKRGVAPGSAGEGTAEPGIRLLDRTEAWEAQTALKLSSAFGGANAALVLAQAPPAVPAVVSSARPVHVSAAFRATLADADADRLARRTGYALDRIARADDLVRLTMAAVSLLEDACGGPGSARGAGIVVGHGLATIETNARFLSRIRAAGAGRAEPRRFPYTTPNAPAGECAVAFGLTGPAFAVGGGPHGGIEAIGVSADLVRSGVVDRVVVVVVDEAHEASERLAPGTSTGAVALLVQGEADPLAVARLVSCSLRLEQASARLPPILPPMSAHRALLPLLGATRRLPGTTEDLTAEVPWGGRASARLAWL